MQSGNHTLPVQFPWYFCNIYYAIVKVQNHKNKHVKLCISLQKKVMKCKILFFVFGFTIFISELICNCNVFTRSFHMLHTSLELTDFQQPCFNEIFFSITNFQLHWFHVCFPFELTVIFNCNAMVLTRFFSYQSFQVLQRLRTLVWVRPRTATGMDGTLTLIFRKSETSRDIIKSF